MNNARPSTQRQRGVVGVIVRDHRFLVIRRSMTVTAPGLLCLPGGRIESGESEPVALIREMQEELTINVIPNRLCWRSVTPTGTNLAWWLADLDESSTPIANPEEVSEIHWMTEAEIRGASEMLPSLPNFIDAIERGEVQLKDANGI